MYISKQTGKWFSDKYSLSLIYDFIPKSLHEQVKLLNKQVVLSMLSAVV